MTDERVTRGRMGRIQQLPQDLQDLLNRLLREGVTQAEILRQLNPLLEQRGERPVSRSGLNRYTTRMAAFGHRMKEAREAAEVWVAKFGEQPTGDIGAAVIEMLRALAFDLSLSMQDADEVDPDALNTLSIAMQRLERAAQTSAKREREIRAESAQAGEKAAKEAGLSPDTAAAIRAVIEGAGK